MEAWRSDLDYLLERLLVRHPDPFHDVSEPAFRSAVHQLQGELPSLDEHERLMALARLMARVGDGHTSYPILWDEANGFRRYPVELHPTADGALVLSAAPGFDALLGAELLAVDGRPLAEVLDRVRPLDSRDNDLGPHSAFALAAVPEVLHAVGAARSIDSVAFELRVPSGEIETRVLPAVPRPDVPSGYDHPPAWRLLGSAGSRPLWLRDRDDAFWLEPLDGARTIYVQYNDASVQENDAGESLAAFTDRLVRLVRSRPVEQVVLDLRWNDGGAAWISRTLLQGLIEAEHALGGRRTGRRGEREPSGHLFVLIGPGTFSAGTLLAAELEWHTSAVFVGQPTGGRPNAYGETGRVRLPETGYTVRTSIAYMQGTESVDTRPALFPDVPVRYVAADLQGGVDPAMEAVRSWKPGDTPENLLVRAYREGGLAAALDRFRLREATLSAPEAQLLLFRLGSHLTELERRDEALRVFSLAAERFPWASWPHARRARIHRARGEEDRAVANACRAYELNYYRTEMLDILEESAALGCARRRRRR